MRIPEMPYAFSGSFLFTSASSPLKHRGAPLDEGLNALACVGAVQHAFAHGWDIGDGCGLAVFDIFRGSLLHESRRPCLDPDFSHAITLPKISVLPSMGACTQTSHIRFLDPSRHPLGFWRMPASDQKRASAEDLVAGREHSGQ